MLPLCAFAEENSTSIYTIQIASFSTVKKADEEFTQITQTINRDELAYLRIEKIGNFYSLRLGKFNSNMDAIKFLESIKAKLPDSMIVNAYFRENRIIRLHEPQKEAEGINTQQTGVQERAGKTGPNSSTLPAAKASIVDKSGADNNVPIEKIIESISSLAQNKDYDNALKITKKALTEKPEHPLLNAWHGTLLLKTNKPSEALHYLEKAVALSPDVPDYHNSLGYCFFYLNKSDKAIKAFDKVLSLEPEHIDALAGLGIIYAKSGKKDRAMNIYSSLKNLDAASADKLLRLVRK